MKSASIFGGVQLFQIIIGIVRSKFIAILLGPLGIGISGLFQSTIALITAVTGFGLSTSSIKSISSALSESDEEKVGQIVAVFKKLMLYTGLFASIVTLIFSSLLSKITFGNYNYTWAFAILSITLLMNQISEGFSVFIRAKREVKLIAKSSIIGSALGLLGTIPLYYFFKINGIVPAIILTSFISIILNYYFASKVSFKKVKVSLVEFKAESKVMIKLGIMISLSNIISLLFYYILRVYINSSGSTIDVGLYTAGFAIINTYVGMIFNAMATEYFPKLSEVANDTKLMNSTVNQQAEIALLIISPLLVFFIFFSVWIIKLLYSVSFLGITQMVILSASGMIFKLLSWAITFIFLAKGASKFYLTSETFFNILMLILNLVGYKYFGLTGLGVSFLISYVVYTFQVFYVAKKYFAYKIDNHLSRLFMSNVLFVLSSLFCMLFLKDFFLYLSGGLLILITSAYNFHLLNKRLEIKNYIKNKFNI